MRFCVCGLKGELNNINNISMLKPYATICGITEEEMLTQMSGHIDQMAQALGCTREETIAKLKQRYDGYHFTWPSPDIYNPFSLTIAEYIVISNQPNIGHTKLIQSFDSPLKLFGHSKFGVVPAMNHEVDVVTSVGMAHEGLRLVMGPLSVANKEETERVLLLTCRLDTGDLGCIDPFGQTAVKPPIVGMIVDEVATDQPSAKDIYSQDKAMLHRKGTPIEDFDLLIASAAKARNLTLVTDNVKHFKGIDNLMIENWVIR